MKTWKDIQEEICSRCAVKKEECPYILRNLQLDCPDMSLQTGGYEMALDDMLAALKHFYYNNLKAAETAKDKPTVTAIFGAAAKEDYEIISYIENVLNSEVK